jgi:hypothetical protein
MVSTPPCPNHGWHPATKTTPKLHRTCAQGPTHTTASTLYKLKEFTYMHMLFESSLAAPPNHHQYQLPKRYIQYISKKLQKDLLEVTNRKYTVMTEHLSEHLSSPRAPYFNFSDETKPCPNLKANYEMNYNQIKWPSIRDFSATNHTPRTLTKSRHTSERATKTSLRFAIWTS